jgi:Fuc2NAc and GlcNAc transferase
VVINLSFLEYVDSKILLATVPPTFVIAVIGFLDDRRELSRLLRFSVQAAMVIWFFLAMEKPLYVGVSWLDHVPILGYVISGLALVWLINLFNFMDGIDGIAASQAIFVALGMVVISSFSESNSSVALINISLAGACIGFLVWNWPPAKIFMGDVGSSSLGFVLGAIALIISTKYAISVWPWVILFGVFLIDATVTLGRRALSGQRWYEAHRSHAYQRLARQWGSHRNVTLTVIGIDVCWLLPMALWAAMEPDYAAAIAGLALLPLTGLALWIGAGHSDTA